STSASARRVVTPWTKRAARPSSAIVVASTPPSSSRTATWTTWDEISVRSASAWAASMRRSILRAYQGDCAQVLRRPRHAPGRDDRVFRAALVRAASLSLARPARRGRADTGGLVLRARAAPHVPEHVARLDPARRARDSRERDRARDPRRGVPALVVALA